MPPAKATAPVAGVAGTMPAPVSAAAVPVSEYRLAPYDIIDVSVFQVKDLDRTVQVSASGKIVLPLIGEVQAAGRTPKEIQADITQKLAVKYLQSPLVSVTIKQAAAQSITVDGAVARPGVFPLTGIVPLSQAIALGGGLNSVGTLDGVTVARKTAGGTQVTRYDVTKIRAGLAPDPVLVAGDIVTVPESGVKVALRSIGTVVAPAASSVNAIIP